MNANNPFPLLAVGIFIGALVVGAAVLVWNHERPFHARPANLTSHASTTATAAPALDPAVSRVASRFVCSCGTCGEKPLDICDCSRAKEERAFIQDQLGQGRSEAEAAEALNQKYGALKSALAGSVAKPASRTAADDRIVPSLAEGQTSPASSSTGRRLGTADDRAHIISHFNCPCGQCGPDKLAECDCTHPKGALEVKRFIDDTIAQNRYSTAEIVDLVQNRYGGKIR